MTGNAGASDEVCMAGQAGGTVAERQIDGMAVRVFADRAAAGTAAGWLVRDTLASLLREQGAARVTFAAAQSQREMLAVLRQARDLAWDRVTTFQMDEYIALPPGVMSLSTFLELELFSEVHPGAVNRMASDRDPLVECQRYERLLREAPIDLVCLGIGESGHLAYNDPPLARFDDERWMRVVEISETSRQQCLNDGHFGAPSDVPRHALTMTVPALLSARKIIGVVPGALRHEALRAACDGPIAESCPASALRTHADCTLFVDREAYEGGKGVVN